LKDHLVLEPVSFACLSLVFPIYKLPSTQIGNGQKIVSWKILLKNAIPFKLNKLKLKGSAMHFIKHDYLGLL
jgi:hypothetical protein